MHVVRAAQAVPYDPPGHHGVAARRLQGLEAGGPAGFAVAVSHYPSGAAAMMAPIAADTVYVVLDGELTVTAGGTSVVLAADDSVYLAAGTTRSVRNHGTAAATLLVVTGQPAR